MMQNLYLGTWDYVTFVSLVTLTAGVGIYHAIMARNQKKTARDFLITNQDLGMLPLILSSIATYLSAVGMLGFPMEAYQYGIQCFAFCLPFFISIVPSCYIFLPVLYNLQIRSIFEYLEMRFNRNVRIYSSALYIFEVIMYTACVIYAPSLALNQVTGLHLWGSIVTVGIICMLYTAMGGIKSVVWADATQVTVMFSVLIFLIIKGCINVGGISEVWKRAQNGSRSTFAYVTSDPQSPYTIWSYIIGGTVGNITEMVSNQMQVQRYLCRPTLKSAYRIVAGGALGTSFIIFLIALLGIVIYATYADCDPLLGGLVTSRNQIVPIFGVQTLSFVTSLPGVFVASLFCATLSTLSSSLNSLASITIEDYVKPCFPQWTEAKTLMMSKLIALFYGILCIVLVAVAESMGSLIQAVFMIFGAIGGPIFSLFLMGIMIPWITSLGASVGFFAGLALGFWGVVGTMVTQPFLPSPPLSVAGCNISKSLMYLNYSDIALTTSALQPSLIYVPTIASSPENEYVFPLYTMPYQWYAAATTLTSLIFALLTTIVTGINDPNDVNDAYVCPIAKKVCCYIHSNICHLLGYGIKEPLNWKEHDTEIKKNVEERDAMLPKPLLDSNHAKSVIETRI